MKHHHLSTNRYCRPLLWALGLGVVSTIATAWLLAAFVRLQAHDQSQIRKLSTPTADLAWQITRGTRIGSMGFLSWIVPRTRGFDQGQIEIPSWAGLKAPGLDGTVNDYTYVEFAEARGLPWLCLRFEYLYDPPTPTHYRGGIRLEGWNPMDGWSAHRVLPCLPIWPGLLGNIAVHSALWFALLAVVRELRRAYRRSRNCCPSCNYSLTGLTSGRCPECGEECVASQE